LSATPPLPDRAPKGARKSATSASAGTLDAQAWVDAAFDVLADGGIDAVRIDPLAKRLGITRGSFYWHFKDRAALHTAMLKDWRKRASYQIGSRIDSRASTPDERLRQNLALPKSGPRAQRAAAIEFAIRLWSLRDKEAAQAVKHIDHVRLQYYAKLYDELGFSPAEARKRAFLFYATLMGQAIIVTDEQTDVRNELADALLGKL
jgi:AcrR family transcriptional regulator